MIEAIGKMWGGYMAIFDNSKEIKLSGEGEIIKTLQ